uniref:hypothetical protein n=1 Tax=Escherichia coli TaxID=562 RepID=UPI0013B00A31
SVRQIIPDSSTRIGVLKSVIAFIASLPFRKMSLFAQKSRPEMVATIYGSSQAQLSERLGIVTRCDARFTADVKKPRECEAKSWYL